MEFILFMLIALIVLVALMASRLVDSSYPFPFDRKANVFTSAEKNFQNLLEQAVGNKYRVINRVKLADLLTIRKGVSKKASQKALFNANNKYVDFAICDKETMALAGVIDLVDTQGKGYKIKKDWFVSGALEAAAIPHVRIKVKGRYSLDEIKACVNSRILGKNTFTPQVKGKVIPAPLLKARPTRPRNTGVVANSTIGLNQIPSPTPNAALPN
jgi:hypothetical protein